VNCDTTSSAEKSKVAENEYMCIECGKNQIQIQRLKSSKKQNNNKKHISITRTYSNANQGSRHA